MLIFIKDMRIHADILAVKFSTGFDVYLTFTMYEHSIDVTINNANVKKEYMDYIKSLSEMLRINILSNYMGLPSNEQTYWSLLAEVGEYIRYLKNDNFESVKPYDGVTTIEVKL